MMTEQFAVTGMTCAACSAHVEKAVSKLSGVQSAPVNLMLGRMTVTDDEKAVTEGDIIAAVKAAGYGASRLSDGSGPAAPGSGRRPPPPEEAPHLVGGISGAAVST